MRARLAKQITDTDGNPIAQSVMKSQAQGDHAADGQRHIVTGRFKASESVRHFEPRQSVDALVAIGQIQIGQMGNTARLADLYGVGDEGVRGRFFPMTGKREDVQDRGVVATMRDQAQKADNFPIKPRGQIDTALAKRLSHLARSRKAISVVGILALLANGHFVVDGVDRLDQFLGKRSLGYFDSGARGLLDLTARTVAALLLPPLRIRRNWQIGKILNLRVVTILNAGRKWMLEKSQEIQRAVAGTRNQLLDIVREGIGFSVHDADARKSALGAQYNVSILLGGFVFATHRAELVSS